MFGENVEGWKVGVGHTFSLSGTGGHQSAILPFFYSWNWPIITAKEPQGWVDWLIPIIYHRQHFLRTYVHTHNIHIRCKHIAPGKNHPFIKNKHKKNIFIYCVCYGHGHGHGHCKCPQPVQINSIRDHLFHSISCVICVNVAEFLRSHLISLQ